MMKTLLQFCSVFISLFWFSSAQSCSKYAFPSNKVFSTCNDLPVLNSFLHWTHNPSSGTLQIAYRHTGITSTRWVAWAINPSAKGMVGSQALVAFQKSDGTMSAYTAPVTSYQASLQQGNLSFGVSGLSATYSNNEIVIFATLKLPNNMNTVNQVWQDGPVSNDAPGMHDASPSAPNVKSMATLNLLSGQTAAAGAGGALNSKLRQKNIHGVLNAVSWGILLPLGVMIARYVKVYEFADPAWFYLHVTCQTSGYIIGVAGWATGLQLGIESPGVQFTGHRNIGIAIFSLATLQMFALLLRPKKDNKYRIYWNVYHHSVGYSVIILSIINIFKGFDILRPGNWEKAYIVVIVVLAVVSVILEVKTWVIFVGRNKDTSTEHKLPYGYGARAQHGV